MSKIRQLIPKEFILENGDLWGVKYQKGMEDYGECDPELQEIRLNPNQNDLDLLDTFIHEILHSVEFSHETDVDHEFIHIAARELAKVLLQR